MKKINITLVSLLMFNLLLPFFKVGAVDYNGVVTSLASRTNCISNQFEVVMIDDGGNLAHLNCHDTYDLAKVDMNNQNSTVTNVATIIYYGEANEIIDTKYGMLDLRTKPERNNTNLFGSATTGSSNNYTNGYYAADAPLLDYNYATKRAKLKIGGYTGWVKKEDTDGLKAYDIIPLSLVKTPTYYYVSTNGELIHRLSFAISQDNGYTAVRNWTINLGRAPSFMLKNIKYYSFDGNYFYFSLLSMIEDYKQDNIYNAINALEPYYNYYQYLPYRSSTAYDSMDINNFIYSKGYRQKALSSPSKAYESMLSDEGPNFIQSQTLFGANAIISLGIAINESGWGSSSIAINKNNLFGHSAYDIDPGSNAERYSDIQKGIFYHANGYVNFGYSHPQDWRYNGSHVGNKASGMNILYASDPYWGEKAAQHYYLFDQANGFQDYKLHRIGLKNVMASVNVRKEPTTKATILYSLKAGIIDIPVAILEEVTGEMVNGSNKWYKIQSDIPLDLNRNIILDSALDKFVGPIYNWNESYGYVHASYINVIDEEIQYTKKEGNFYFDKLDWDNTTQTFNIRGYLTIKEVNNIITLPASYSLILKDMNDSNKEYIIPIDRWVNSNEHPFLIPSQDGYDYSASWFNANISLVDIPEGDYNATIRARTNKAETIAIFRNMFSKAIASKAVDNQGRGYLFRTNFYIKEVPLEIFIRNDGLISDVPSLSVVNMINTYHVIDFNNNLLNIKGTSFNIGADYGADKTVTRKIILENIDTYERVEFNSNYIDNGDYEIVLNIPDGLSKKRGWFDSVIDLENLKLGTYAIYIKTKTNNYEDYGELNDVFMRPLNKQVVVGDKMLSLRLNENKRMRIELVVSQH